MQKTNRNSPSQSNKSSITSKIDLDLLTLQELMDLRDLVENKLVQATTCNMSPQDVLIEYNLRARANGEIVHRSYGTLPLPAFLNPRLISASEQKLQTAIYNTILEPLNADLLDVLETVPIPGVDHNLIAVNQHVPRLSG